MRAWVTHLTWFAPLQEDFVSQLDSIIRRDFFPDVADAKGEGAYGLADGDNGTQGPALMLLLPTPPFLSCCFLVEIKNFVFWFPFFWSNPMICFSRPSPRFYYAEEEEERKSAKKISVDGYLSKHANEDSKSYCDIVDRVGWPTFFFFFFFFFFF